MGKIYDSMILLLLILIFLGFVWLQGTPAPASPIEYLQGFQNPGGSGSGSRSGSGSGSSHLSSAIALPTRTLEMNTAKKTICNLQKVFDDQRCSAYLLANPTPPPNPFLLETSKPPPPSVGFTANIENLSNFAVVNADIRTFVKEHDMIYFGYTLDMQGPFIVKLISFASGSTTLTFTKKYVGPSLQNSVMAIVVSSAQPAVNSGTITVAERAETDEVKKEVFMFDGKSDYTLSTAQTACATFGAEVATLEQMRQANRQGLDVRQFSLVKNDAGAAIAAISLQTPYLSQSLPAGVTSTTILTSTTSALACYGVKPVEGTPIGNTGGTIKPFSPELYNNPFPITGYVQAGTNYITTTNTVLPESLEIGETVYIQGKCNQYDTDNGNTCTAYGCNVGETDLLSENKCQRYACRAKTGNQSDHINNGDGTCTVPKEYITCPSVYDILDGTFHVSGFQGITTTVTQQNSGDITLCSYTNLQMARDVTYRKEFGNWVANTETTTIIHQRNKWFDDGWTPTNTLNIDGKVTIGTVTRSFGLKNKAYSYDIIKAGVKDTQYVKTSWNPSYTYPKVLGPYAIAANPAVGKILLKSKNSGDFDANGTFGSVSESVWKIVATNVSSFPIAIPSDANHSRYSNPSNVYGISIAYPPTQTASTHPARSISASNKWTCVLHENGQIYSYEKDGDNMWRISYGNTDFSQISLDGFNNTLMGIKKKDTSLWYANTDIYSAPNWTQVDGRFIFVSHSNGQFVAIGLNLGLYYSSVYTTNVGMIEISGIFPPLTFGEIGMIPQAPQVSFDGYNKSVALLNDKRTVFYKKLAATDTTNKVSASFGLQNVVINKITSTENIIANLVKKGKIINYNDCAANAIVMDLANKNKLPGDNNLLNATRYKLCSPYYNNVVGTNDVPTIIVLGNGIVGYNNVVDDRKPEYKIPRGISLTKNILGCAANTYADGLSCIKCPAGKTSVVGGVCTDCPAGQSSVSGGPCTP